LGNSDHSYGSAVSNTQGAVWDSVTTPRPADSIQNPDPDEASVTYTVGWFHTHTPTFYRASSYAPGTTRGVGPSAGDHGFGSHSTINIPGYAYDYTATIGGSIPMGHPLNAAAQIYNVTPPDRRPTPQP